MTGDLLSGQLLHSDLAESMASMRMMSFRVRILGGEEVVVEVRMICRFFSTLVEEIQNVHVTESISNYKDSTQEVLRLTMDLNRVLSCSGDRWQRRDLLYYTEGIEDLERP